MRTRWIHISIINVSYIFLLHVTLCGILTYPFFAETFQPMNATLIFQTGLNDCARAIRGIFTFAGVWESFQRMRT